MGSLIDGGDYVIMLDCKLTTAAGVLTGARSLISKAETEFETLRL